MAAQSVVGDLRTAEGLDDAVRGAGVIVHCATAYGKGDIAMSSQAKSPPPQSCT
jgi:hypothetical protein